MALCNFSVARSSLEASSSSLRAFSSRSKAARVALLAASETGSRSAIFLSSKERRLMPNFGQKSFVTSDVTASSPLRFRHRRAQRPDAEGQAAQDLRAGDPRTLQLPLRLLSRIKCSTCASKSVLHWKEKPMGAALSFLGQKLFASSTLINARCENISCCTSVAAVQPPIVRRTGGFLKKRMTTIYVDSRKRVAGSDSDFEVDLGESPGSAPTSLLPRIAKPRTA